MAYSPKTDYCGLLAAINPASPAAALIDIRDDNENASQSTYMAEGESGAIIGIEVYGENATPSNSYALKGAITATAGKIKLGTVTTITTGTGAQSVTKKYRLTSVKFGTSTNSPVTIDASAQLVEPSAVNDDTKNFVVPAFELDTAHIAQDAFSAFTLTGTGAHLSSIDAEAKLNCTTDTLVGNIISNGVGGATLTVSGNVIVKGDVVPTLTPTQDSGFVVSKKPTCSNPETAYKTYSFELVKPLELYTSSSET